MLRVLQGLIATQTARKVFNWKVSALLIPLFLALGVAMIGIAASLEDHFAWLFIAADNFFFLTSLWLLGLWVNSDFLRTKDPDTWNRQKRKRLDLRKLHRIHRIWKWSGCVVAVALFILLGTGTTILSKQKELSKMYGILLPANDPDPPNTCTRPIAADALAIYYGNAVAYSQSAAMSIITVGGKEVLGIERSPDQTVALNADVRSSDGKVVAAVSRNRFAVNKNNIMESLFRRPDRSTIRLTDQYGNALVVRYLNPRAFRIVGKFFLGPNQEIELTETNIRVIPQRMTFYGGCFGNARTVFAF